MMTSKLEAKVLLVDDSSITRTMISDLLRQEGEISYHIETAATGVECLTKLLAYKPDLIITDHYMPRMCGLDMLRRIKDDPQFSSVSMVPIIVITGDFQQQLYDSFISEGVKAVLIKPFAATKLRALADRILKVVL